MKSFMKKDTEMILEQCHANTLCPPCKRNEEFLAAYIALFDVVRKSIDELASKVPNNKNVHLRPVNCGCDERH